MKAEPYLSVNPMGKVPAIVHDGKVVTECAAICAYLAEAFPDAGLAPAGRRPRRLLPLAVLRGGAGRAGGDQQGAGFRAAAEQGRMFGYGNFDQAIDVLEKAVSAHDYIAGDRFTAADVYVGRRSLGHAVRDWLPKRAEFGDYLAPHHGARRLPARGGAGRRPDCGYRYGRERPGATNSPSW